jgi:hypothetical protein
VAGSVGRLFAPSADADRPGFVFSNDDPTVDVDGTPTAVATAQQL